MLPKTTTTQAERVIAKFGGVPQLGAILRSQGYRVDDVSIYKWTYPKERGGTDGRIPYRPLMAIKAAARLQGVLLTDDDLYPRELPVAKGTP